MAGTSATAAMVLTRPELNAWGEALGRGLRPPVVVAVSGDLGSGKTTLAQAVCRGLGVTGEVTSPTYALVHEYAAPRGTIFHLDLYRLEGPQDLTNLGFDDILTAGGVVIIEWPDRAGDRLPADRMEIVLEHVPGDATRRRVHVA